MNLRVAAAIYVLLILAVAVGWCAHPETTHSATPAHAAYVEVDASDTDVTGSAVTISAMVFGCLISGAAMIGGMFFGPRTPKGPRMRGALSAQQLVNLFVERARRGLADRHQELEVVLRFLQAIDQQIDRLVRIQAGQYTAQLVQHRRLVGAEQ